VFIQERAVRISFIHCLLFLLSCCLLSIIVQVAGLGHITLTGMSHTLFRLVTPCPLGFLISIQLPHHSNCMLLQQCQHSHPTPPCTHCSTCLPIHSSAIHVPYLCTKHCMGTHCKCMHAQTADQMGHQPRDVRSMEERGNRVSLD
jgi:hypothetical protein